LSLGLKYYGSVAIPIEKYEEFILEFDIFCKEEKGS
jgi:hypothetical protein